MNQTKIGIYIASIFLFGGCGKYNQQYFLNEAFGFDLLAISENYEKEIKNGLLIIKEVESDSELYKRCFPQPPKKTEDYFPIYYLGEEISNYSWRNAYFLKWKSFNGNTLMSVYYPKNKLLLLGYFSGCGG